MIYASCVPGTILPAIWRGEPEAIWQAAGAGFVLAGIIIGTAGILASGMAGRFKEIDQGGKREGFDLVKGLPLGVREGVLSAVYGAGYFQSSVICIFDKIGAFCTTATCSLRLRRHFVLAVLTDWLGYEQFFFYGLAHVRTGNYKFSSRTIHMIMPVLFSSLAGFIWREVLQPIVVALEPLNNLTNTARPMPPRDVSDWAMAQADDPFSGRQWERGGLDRKSSPLQIDLMKCSSAPTFFIV